MDTLVTHMTRIRWRVSLALERLANKVAFEVRYPPKWYFESKDPQARFDRFVDRVSPWIEHRGYRRVRVRRLLYRLRYPRRHFTDWLVHRLDNVLKPWSDHPGRYEGNASQLIAEWLDTHSGWEDDTFGDSDTVGFYQIFGLSGAGGEPEGVYITQTDSQGFFTYTEYESYEAAMVDWLAMVNDPRNFYETDDDESPSYDDSFFTPAEIMRANSLSSDGGQA